MLGEGPAAPAVIPEKHGRGGSLDMVQSPAPACARRNSLCSRHLRSRLPEYCDNKIPLQRIVYIDRSEAF